MVHRLYDVPQLNELRRERLLPHDLVDDLTVDVFQRDAATTVVTLEEVVIDYVFPRHNLFYVIVKQYDPAIPFITLNIHGYGVSDNPDTFSFLHPPNSCNIHLPDVIDSEWAVLNAKLANQ